MQADGLETWHIDKIFTLLPLLLQSALVLFLGGVIDFLYVIGHWTMVIPVTSCCGNDLDFPHCANNTSMASAILAILCFV